MRKALTLLALASVLDGCAYISFGRRVSDDELLLRQDVKLYYASVQRAFASANPDALTSLFAPSITHPMTLPQIRDWAEKFFKENGGSRFVIDRLEVESIGPSAAVTLLTYHVETAGGKGDFKGTERDTLSRRRGHWYVSAWDKQ